MWSLFWIGFGIFLWVTGYFHAGFTEEDGAPISRAFIRPPSLIYFLCGKPTASNIPKGVLSLRSLISQTQGILFLIYGTGYRYLSDYKLSTQMIILSLVSFGIFLLCWLLYKRHPYLFSSPNTQEIDRK